MPALGETLEKAEIDFRFRLPSRRFNRAIGSFAGHSFDPEGRPLAAEEFDARRDEWLPGSADRRHLAGLRSEAVTEPGRMANWIAPPRRGVDGRAPDFEYVRSD